ncbi:MAG: Rsd/AlgQ family anti-sigma factor [Pseudomonadales bacterium]|nr:Rsd/AlgQ family anti-sigma factor [Pseudomonadales bacterium]
MPHSNTAHTTHTEKAKTAHAQFAGQLFQQQTTRLATQKEISRSRALVLSYLLKLKKCIDAQHDDLVQALCTRFREYLIDYISYGHFRLFEVYDPEPHHVTTVEHVTNLALQFDRRYRSQPTINLARLRDDLEELALAMEARFEVEDEITIISH